MPFILCSHGGNRREIINAFVKKKAKQAYNISKNLFMAQKSKNIIKMEVHVL